MNPQLELFSQALTEVLFHSLWKVALVAVALKVWLMTTPQRYGALRHASACLALVVAAAWSLSSPLSSPGSLGSPLPVLPFITNPSAASITTSISVQDSPSLPGWLCFAWGLGLAALVIRTLLAKTSLSKLEKHAPALPDRSSQIRLEELRSQSCVRRKISLQMSQRVSSPMTFGWIRPVIIIPTSMATGMPLTHLEAILAHELAHVIRYDFLTRILTMSVTSLFYFNPAIWWIARQIDRESEAACDDLAVSMLGGPGEYLTALVDAEKQRLPFALGFGSYSTLSRAKRLLKIHGAAPSQSRKPEWLLICSLLVAFLTQVPLRLDGTQLSAGSLIEDTRSARDLLERPSLWLDHQSRHQNVPLFRSIVILEKNDRAINPLSEDEPVFSEFPNSWVRKHGLSFLEARLPAKDSDNDGFTNHEEFLAQTSPVLTESRPSYLLKLQFLESRNTLYPIRYSARPGNDTVQLNGYDDQGRIRSTDFLKVNETTEDGLFQIVTISDQEVTVLFILKNEMLHLPKGKTMIPSLSSAILRLPILSGETIEVTEGANFRLSHEPGQSFHLESIADEQCIVSRAGGKSRRIPRGSQ